MSQISSFSALAANVVHHASHNIERSEQHARARAPHRTGAPVLRNSKEAGTFEHKFFVPPAIGETDKMLRSARKLIDSAKRLRRERLNGRKLTVLETAIVALTPAAVRVFEEILTLARLNGGRVYPSYERIADATELGRSTVSRAIAILNGIGLLDWQRRFKRVEIEGAGPRYKQTSNAYRPALPARLAAYLPRWMRRPPVPIDEAHNEAERVEDCQRMYDTLSCRDLARTTGAGGALGDQLARLGAAVDAKSASTETGLNR